MRVRHIVICNLSGSTMFFHVISYKILYSGEGGGAGEVIEHKIVFLFSLQLLPKTFLILRRTDRSFIINVNIFT